MQAAKPESVSHMYTEETPPSKYLQNEKKKDTEIENNQTYH